jgi:hypothetical protein
MRVAVGSGPNRGMSTLYNSCLAASDDSMWSLCRIRVGSGSPARDRFAPGSNNVGV